MWFEFEFVIEVVISFRIIYIMKTSSYGNISRVTGSLWGKFTGQRWIPLNKASDAELWGIFVCAWTNDWVNNRDPGDSRRHRAHHDFTVMYNNNVDEQ